MIVNSVSDLCSSSLFIRLPEFVPHATVHLKIEGLNIAGSIKLKTARRILDDLQARGVLKRGSSVIESSSGNVGVALAFLCAERGYSFTCVSDPNMSPPTHRLITALGGNVIVVQHRDPEGGYLRTRIDLICTMVARDPTLVWTDQYSNLSNLLAHYSTTGPEILESFPTPDWVFVGAGTTGTLAGTSRYLREHSPKTHIVAVDTVGSVTFGTAAAVRYLPGMGTGVRPRLTDECSFDTLSLIREEDAAVVCLRLARESGLFLGASSGSVLAAVMQAAGRFKPDDTIVAVSPDLGDRYIETLYDNDWINTRFPQIESALRAFEHVHRPAMAARSVDVPV